MKKILVLTDFSAAANNAVEYAIMFAKAFGAQVQLLHVYRELIPASVGPEPWSINVTERHIENERRINKEIDRLQNKFGIAVEGNVKNGGRGNMIDEAVKDLGADILVMGTGTKNKMFGSTVLKAIRKTVVPVIIVPPETKFTPPKNIVLAVDFNSLVSNTSIDPLYKIYKKFAPSMRVLHIDKKGADMMFKEVPGKMQLATVLSRFTYLYDRVEYNDIEKGIERFVNDHPTDMLVMIAHKHTIFEKLFGTLHTQEVSVFIDKPLLVLKQQ